MFKPKMFLFLLSLGALSFLAGCGLGSRAARGWTFLVYLAADNDLDPYAALDLQEMMAVGSTPDLAIVVQYDPSPPGAATKRYRVTKGGLLELGGLGETNTGDGATLEEFVAWGMRRFPARRYALVLWNHGSGIFDGFPPNRGQGDGPPHRAQAVAIDRTSGNDALTTREYARALGRATEMTGRRLEILCFDACYMQMVEVAAELAADDGRPLAGYLAGSEAAVPAEGLDYEAILSWLASHPEADGAALAAFTVESYGKTYAHSDATFSALSLAGSGWTALLEEIRRLAGVIVAADGDLKAALKEAALSARSFVDYRDPASKDLADFVRLLEEKAAGRPEIVEMCQRIGALLLPGNGLIIRRVSTGALADGRTGGLAVFLPTSSAWLADYPEYAGLRFAALTGWDEAAAAIASAGESAPPQQ